MDPVIIFVSFLVIFMLKIELGPYFLFLAFFTVLIFIFIIFNFHCNIHGSIKAEDTGATDGRRQLSGL